MVQYVVSIGYLAVGSFRLRAVHRMLLITVGSRGAVGNWETLQAFSYLRPLLLPSAVRKAGGGAASF